MSLKGLCDPLLEVEIPNGVREVGPPQVRIAVELGVEVGGAFTSAPEANCRVDCEPFGSGIKQHLDDATILEGSAQPTLVRHDCVKLREDTAHHILGNPHQRLARPSGSSTRWPALAFPQAL